MKSLVRSPGVGTGFLAVFCDLDAEWVADFRPWLERDMIPPRLDIGFGPAASFDAAPDLAAGRPPGGDMAPQAYVTIYVAPTLGALYDDAYQGLRIKRQPLDAAYHERMRNHSRYTASWAGPGIEHGGQTYAPVIVFDRFDISATQVQSFNIWYETQYLPGCLAVPGLAGLRRYLAMEGDRRHLIVHEFAGADGLDDAAWRELRRASAWNVCDFAPGAPAAYRRILSQAPR